MHWVRNIKIKDKGIGQWNKNEQYYALNGEWKSFETVNLLKPGFAFTALSFFVNRMINILLFNKDQAL